MKYTTKDLARITDIFTHAQVIDAYFLPHIGKEDLCFEVTKEDWDFAEILFSTFTEIWVKVGEDAVCLDGALIPINKVRLDERYFLVVPGDAITAYLRGRYILYGISAFMDKGESE